MNVCRGQQRTRSAGWIAAGCGVVVALYAIRAGFKHEWPWCAFLVLGLLTFGYVALWNFGIVKYTFKGIRRR